MAANLAFLHGAEVLDIDDGVRPIRTAKSSVIGLVGTSGKGPVNEPSLVVGSRREGVAKHGAWLNDGFTIPESLDAIFDQTGAVVVVVNVCDPAVHNSNVVGELISFSTASRAQTAKGYISDVAVSTTIHAPVVNRGAFVQLPAGATGVALSVGGNVVADAGVYTSATGRYVFDNVKVPIGTAARITYVKALVAGTDYALDLDSGVFTRSPTGNILPGATLAVDYTHVDPAKVTSANVVGGVNAETGNFEGVHCLLGAKHTVHVQPRVLIAPRHTHQKASAFVSNPVVAELQGIAERLKAVILADGPNTTDEEAISARRDWGSKRIFFLDPWVKVADPKAAADFLLQPLSARAAGVIARTDNDNGFWWSPSNQIVNGILGTGRPVQYDMGDVNCRANYLNENEVTTVIRDDGYRLWGNRTTSSDPKWAFLSVVRTADMVNESILFGHKWAQDRPISKTLLVDIVDGVKAFLRQLRSVGAILGGDAWADPTLNTPEVLAAGQLYIDFDFTAPSPAERITFRSHLVNDYFEEIFV